MTKEKRQNLAYEKFSAFYTYHSLFRKHTGISSSCGVF